MRRGVLLASAWACWIWSGCHASFQPFPAPEWSLTDLDGNRVASHQFAGQVVILDFWATWCPPCREEIPAFIELQNEFGSKGLVVVGVALDQEGPRVVTPFVRRMKINYPVVVGNDEVTQQFGGIEGLPTTFIINRQGQVVERFLGYRSKAEFVRAIRPWLDE